MSAPARLGVLLSGRGSNLLALHSAIQGSRLKARIVVVISNQPEAPGILRARELGLDAVSVPHRGAGGRVAHEALLLSTLQAAEVEWICLAGYMRLLSPAFVASFPWRIVNIHPSLLPAFPGLEAPRQAVEYGARYSGCTVHLVDGGLDSGPIVDQRVVPLEPSDTPDTLADRILTQEHELYPEALNRLITEPWRLDGRRLIFGETSACPSKL